MNRIVIVGASGAGKTTLAKILSQRLGLPRIEMDALYWGPNWSEPGDEEMGARIAKAIASDGWILDGNYKRFIPLVWPQADTVLWLDYPRPVVLWQVVRRTALRLVTRTELWAGNRERLRETLSRESVVVWSMRSYRPHRNLYNQIFREGRFPNIEMHRFGSRKQLKDWLAQLRNLA